MSRGIMFGRGDWTILAALLALLTSVPASTAFVSYQSNSTTARRFMVSQVQTHEYPYTVHLPDRTTRNLPPLTTPPPLLLSLSGSGARGPANESSIVSAGIHGSTCLGSSCGFGVQLSGYDGASRKIGQYNTGQRTPAHLMAAEEFLTVTPVCPADTPQNRANWNTSALPSILAEVAETYEVDLNRVYLSTYSMGTRAAWGLLMAYPDIFAGAILSSGATYAQQDALSDIVGIPIRNFVGTQDEDGLAAATATTMARYNAAFAAAQSRGSVSSTSGRLQTVSVPGANHLAMTNGPWDSTTMVDGQPGALAWLITQRRSQPAQIPGLDLTEYTSAQSTSASSTQAVAGGLLGAAAAPSAVNSSIAASTGGAGNLGIDFSVACFLSGMVFFAFTL